MGFDPISVLLLQAGATLIDAEQKRQRKANRAPEEATREPLSKEAITSLLEQAGANRASRASLAASQTRLGRRASFLGQVDPRTLLGPEITPSLRGGPTPPRPGQPPRLTTLPVGRTTLL
jgi:hypothetical protein